jgi:hypothetical protein
VLLRVGDPEAAANYVWTELADDDNGGNTYVIVRADVLDGNAEYNLVIPVDAALGELENVFGLLRDDTALGVESSALLRVVSHEPSVPHRGFSFITPGEFDAYPLPELCPPGRHPQSPGANPWG